MAQQLTKIRTKGDRKGDIYTRPPIVEAEIDEARDQTHEELFERLFITDPKTKGHLRSECLVHLIRHAMTHNTDYVFNRLLPVLQERCRRILKNRIWDGIVPDADGLRDEILCEFTALFVEDYSNPDHNKLDYYECRFNSAFLTFRLDRLNKAENYFDNFKDPPKPQSEGDGISDDDALALASTESWQLPEQEGDVMSRALYEAIYALPPDIRKAVVLCKVQGFSEESKDQHKTTAATLCSCSGRTIRNRLTKAKDLLAPFKEYL